MPKCSGGDVAFTEFAHRGAQAASFAGNLAGADAFAVATAELQL